MGQHDLPDKASYEDAYHAGMRYEGHGASTAAVVPCPFCAAPNWLRTRVLDSRERLAEGATCEQCGRSGRLAVRDERHGALGYSIRAEFVQTGGEDPPPYLAGVVRREEPEA